MCHINTNKYSAHQRLIVLENSKQSLELIVFGNGYRIICRPGPCLVGILSLYVSTHFVFTNHMLTSFLLLSQISLEDWKITGIFLHFQFRTATLLKLKLFGAECHGRMGGRIKLKLSGKMSDEM